MNAAAEQSLRLLRTAVRGPAGQGAILTNAAPGIEVGMPWFEPRYWIARGALVAARWVVGRPPGLYSMADVLGL